MSWYDKYMKNMVTIDTLNRLVQTGKLTQEEVDNIVQKRLDEFGY